MFFGFSFPPNERTWKIRPMTQKPQKTEIKNANEIELSIPI